ncbi:MAG: alpha-amylase family glycosyl hydrolase [bacterium]
MLGNPKDNLATLHRKPIPLLTPRSLLKGEAGIIQRSFTFGKKNFSRLFRDDPLDLTVTLNAHNGHPPLVMLHTDIGETGPGEWRDIPFSSTDEKVFRLTLTIPRCGLYRFRIKYSLDGGDQWFWDRAPHSCLMVDPPSMRSVRLYTLIPSASGTISDWKRLLPHIAGMGFDAIHLLPISQMGYSESPYAATNLFDVEARYRDPDDPRSTLDQFEDFVEECRKHNIRLCLDLVLNHVAIDSQMTHARPDWIVPDDAEPDGFKRAGCWHMHSWIRWEDLAPIHYDHPNNFVRNDIWDYMKQYAAFWSNYAAYTGGMVRFDNLHSSNAEFVADLSASLRESFPDLVIFGEYFTDELTLERTVPEWGINLLLANSWEYPFGPQFRHYIGYLHNVAGRLRHLCAITTHDTGVPAQLFGSSRSVMPRYAICALYTMGQTGLVQGVEAGVTERIPFIGQARKLDLPPHPEYCDFISRINAILVSRPVFAQGGNLTFVDGGHEAILGAFRRDLTGKGRHVLLLSNLDIDNRQAVMINLANCQLSYPLTLREVSTGETIQILSPEFEMVLESCGVKVFEL